jgi:hypothetical protein
MQVSLYFAILTYCRFRWLQRLFFISLYIYLSAPCLQQVGVLGVSSFTEYSRISPTLIMS